MEDIKLLTYKEVLIEIEGVENHLLIGNGFNYGLGINTGYKSIFLKMIENNLGVYRAALPMVEESGFDLEEFIGRLEKDIDSDNLFLKKYICNKIKLDFMQAAHEIVKSEIKNIYAEKNEGVFLLLQNFTNYFSLNYDSCLYLLLLKYKTIDKEDKNTIAFETSLKFIEDDLDRKQNNIYTEIKEARKNGNLEINFGDEESLMKKAFRYLTKLHFLTEVKDYSKSNKRGWKTKDINRVVKQIFEEENQIRVLSKVDDGSKQLNLFENESEFVFDVKSKTQNLFFLHGAFHIFKDGISTKKITQLSDKALYERLEEILNSDNKDIVCVFQHKNKQNVIEKDEYLLNCFNKLGELSGNMIVIGSSLADNDNHIFNQIESSNVETVYISTLQKDAERFSKLAKDKFPSKNIYLFDAETISYEIIEK
jgi:hypothetical protein